MPPTAVTRTREYYYERQVKECYGGSHGDFTIGESFVMIHDR